MLREVPSALPAHMEPTQQQLELLFAQVAMTVITMALQVVVHKLV